MRPTSGQIERARLVSLWRRLLGQVPGLHFNHYYPDDAMSEFNLPWPLDDWHNGPDLRPDQLAPNLPYGVMRYGRRRIISNPPRPLAPPPDLELPDDFPY